MRYLIRKNTFAAAVVVIQVMRNVLQRWCSPNGYMEGDRMRQDIFTGSERVTVLGHEARGLTQRDWQT